MLLLPPLRNVPDKAAAAQTAANQAALACALERYRLANGQFPDTLAALTPQFMAHAPNDVITGQPFKYRRTEDAQFILYSVGWDEKDDGGVPGKSLFDLQGDWVWSYPAK
jgi:type II secretory pathway pseudopilin PulG